MTHLSNWAKSWFDKKQLSILRAKSRFFWWWRCCCYLAGGGRVLLITFVDSAYIIVMKWECSQVQCLLILIICNCTILCYFLFSLGQRKWLPHEHSILATTLYIIFHKKNYKTPCKQNRQNMENASSNPYPLAAWWAVSTKIYGKK